MEKQDITSIQLFKFYSQFLSSLRQWSRQCVFLDVFDYDKTTPISFFSSKIIFNETSLLNIQLLSKKKIYIFV